MNADQAAAYLRDSGAPAADKQQGQRIAKTVPLGLKLHSHTAPVDPLTPLRVILTPLPEIRDGINLAPDLYPPEAGATAG